MEKKSFVYGVPVSGYNFTGREEETRRLLADFQGGINVILMSPRRLGKTSLVKHTLQQVDREQILVVYVDIFGCKSEYEIYNKLASAILQQTASQRQLWLEEAKDFIYRLSPKISISPDPYSEYSVSLGITPKTHTPEEILSLPENAWRMAAPATGVVLPLRQQASSHGQHLSQQEHAFLSVR